MMEKTIVTSIMLSYEFLSGIRTVVELHSID